MIIRLVTIFLCFLLSLRMSNNSLFSRYRNPNVILAPPEEPELDDDTYEQLLKEIPELRANVPRDFGESNDYDYMIRNANERLNNDANLNSEAPFDSESYLDSDANETSDTPLDNDADNDVQLNNDTHLENNSIVYGPVPRTDVVMWNATNNDSMLLGRNGSYKNIARFPWFWWWRWDAPYIWFYKNYKGKRMTSCYVCNTAWERRIPDSSLCHDAFESQDGRAKTLARYFRTRCYKAAHNSEIGLVTPPHKSKFYYQTLYQHQSGLYKSHYLYNTIKGCYKRWVDVGKIYTARGCRQWLPGNGGAFANHRFRRLELLLKGQKNACIFSPHASLTPFSRAISLYVRYHVCVCEGKFCNAASASVPHLPLLLLVLIYLCV